MKQTPVENFVIFMLLLLLFVQTSAHRYLTAENFKGADLYADVVQYVKFGIHRTGTEGDNRTSEWIKGILDKNGFKTEYVTFPVEQFFPEKTQLNVNGKTLEIFPVWPVANPEVTVTGELADAQKGEADISGKIVWINQVSKERSFSFLHEKAPKPADVRLWFHLGASFATYAYSKSGSGVEKLAGVDTNRIVYYAGDVDNSVSRAFEKVKINKVKDKAYGELVVAKDQGYSRFIGLVGTASFPLFHTQYDDASTTSPKLLEEMANAVRAAIELELGKDSNAAGR